MKVNLEKHRVERRSQNIDEGGYKLLISIFDNEAYGLPAMTVKELEQLRDALDDVLYNLPNENPWLEPDKK